MAELYAPTAAYCTSSQFVPSCKNAYPEYGQYDASATYMV